jgi:hypothetical protein
MDPAIFALAFPGHQSDESSCANQAQKRIHHHVERRSHHHRNHRYRCGTGRDSLRRRRPPRRRVPPRTRTRPESQTAAKGCKAKPAPKKEPKAGKKATKPSRAKDPSTPRAESKGARILELIGRPKSASLAEMQKAMDWQAHSVGGFLSTAAKKYGLKTCSDQERRGTRASSGKPPRGTHVRQPEETHPPEEPTNRMRTGASPGRWIRPRR